MPTDQNHTLRPGTELHSASGRIYTIESVIGQGGFGVTYTAFTTPEDENVINGTVRVCVKELFLREHCVRQSDSRTVSCPGTEYSRGIVRDAYDDFLAEGRRLMELDEKSPNIVHVWEVFEDNGTAYYAMDYIQGENLNSLIARGPLPESEIRRLITPIVEAVAMLHRERFTHLDIKPGNIMLARTKRGERPVLIDFGLSKHYNPDGSATSTVNTRACSDGYAPMEQYQGITTFSPTADVYALGATMYALATGAQTPKSGEWTAKGRAIDALPLSPTLKAVIARAMASHASDRFPDAGAMLEALSGEAPADAPQPLPSHKTEIIAAGGEGGRGGFPRWIIAVILAVAAVAFVAMFMLRGCNRTAVPVADTLAIDTIVVITDPQPQPQPSPAPAPSEENTPSPMQEPEQPSPLTNQETINGLTVRWNGVSDAEKSVIRRLIENMVYVQGGTFTMGATAEQFPEANDVEKPAHQVTLSDYRIGRYEVTQAEWKAVMNGANPSYFTGDNLPVEQVSWNDCQTFISNLNSKTGLNFHLPTEAQWEYAARGGNRSRGYKYAGSNDLGSVALTGANAVGQNYPVGSKSPNELGLYDMSGNLWEWCWDWFGAYHSSNVTNPNGPSSGSRRVGRGGGWSNSGGCLRVSFRDLYNPNYSGRDLGFRLSI